MGLKIDFEFFEVGQIYKTFLAKKLFVWDFFYKFQFFFEKREIFLPNQKKRKFFYKSFTFDKKGKSFYKMKKGNHFNTILLPA